MLDPVVPGLAPGWPPVWPPVVFEDLRGLTAVAPGRAENRDFTWIHGKSARVFRVHTCFPTGGQRGPKGFSRVFAASMALDPRFALQNTTRDLTARCAGFRCSRTQNVTHAFHAERRVTFVKVFPSGGDHSWFGSAAGRGGGRRGRGRFGGAPISSTSLMTFMISTN